MVPPGLRSRRAAALLAVVLAVGVAAVLLAANQGADSPAGRGSSSALTASGGARYAFRGIYGRDPSSTGFARSAELGFNLIDSPPTKQRMDALAAHGLKALVWLGGFSNRTCRFLESDAWIRTKVRSIAGDSAVGAYFIDDEPDTARCPSAPAAIRARASLVHSIDPGPPTLMVTFHINQLPAFAHATDVIGLDHYPCSIAHGCDLTVIRDEAAAADRLGIRYWGVIQAFGDDYYKVPTPEELDQEFNAWNATKMAGYLVFAWRWPAGQPQRWLTSNPGLQARIARYNTTRSPPR